MAEATQRLQQHKLRASMAVATRTLALQAAMWAIKRQLKAQGVKVSHFPHRELVTRAEQYLADHCEALITEAKALVEQWRVQGSFGKRAAQMAFINNRSLNSPSSQGAILMDNSPRPPTPPTTVNRTMRCPNAELRTREHLTTQEVEALIEAAGANRQGHRDALMILLAFRHGLRASEVCDLRWEQIDFKAATLHVRRTASADWPRASWVVQIPA